MDEFRFNNKILRDRRRELRINQTETEKKLWELVRNRRLSGHKFCRQYSIGGYILDFYCPKLRLGIELDGSQHGTEETVAYDKDREKILEASNVQIIRFWNDEIINNIEKVLEKINLEINSINVVPGSPLLS